MSEAINTQSPEDQLKAVFTNEKDAIKKSSSAILSDKNIGILSVAPSDPNSSDYVDWYYKNKDAIEAMKKTTKTLSDRWEKFLSIAAQKMPEYASEPEVTELTKKIELLKQLMDSALAVPTPKSREKLDEPQLTPRERIFSSDIDVISRTNIGLVKNLGLLATDASEKTNGYWLIEVSGKNYVLKAKSDTTDNGPVFLAEIDSSLLGKNDNYTALKNNIENLKFRKAELDDSSLFNTFDVSDIGKTLMDLPLGQLTAAGVAEALILKLGALSTRGTTFKVDMLPYKQKIVDALNKLPLMQKLGANNVTKAVLVATITAVLANILFTDRDLIRGDLGSKGFFDQKSDKSSYVSRPDAAGTIGTPKQQNADIAEILKQLK